MLNVSPIGRSCSQEERDAFEAYDKVRVMVCDSVCVSVYVCICVIVCVCGFLCMFVSMRSCDSVRDDVDDADHVPDHTL
jgi:hypothetical protein